MAGLVQRKSLGRTHLFWSSNFGCVAWYAFLRERPYGYRKEKQVVSDMQEARTGRKRKLLPGFGGSTSRTVLGLAVLASAWLVILVLDWSKMVEYVLFRQDFTLREASNQAWVMFIWATTVGWWYIYLLRQNTGWESWKARAYWLTPLLAGAFYAGMLVATARLMLFNNDIGRQAIGVTFGVGWPLLILTVIGLEWSSRRN